ncbi:MAG: hypothetical protein CO060_01685 [Candidatus Yonathbacteria bacterium CG_4_9_14_0_2_um_filter_43_16]|nr:MAG: hypothetical protein CO060_01685 [Candidatus Yonathbacteria bacterium CG_4_9_14_0_2_um_filter_43_16]
MQKKAGWAKYLYFSGVASSGLFLAMIGFGLVTPLTSVHARAFFYFGGKSDKTPVVSASTEAQNSQTIAFLEAATNVDPRKAMGGGDITIIGDSAFISDAGPTGTIADIESSGHQGKVSLYVVRSGDTISQVANMFGVTVETILWANDLTRGSVLREGQHLVILPIDGVQHTVQKGDTLRGVANKYKGDLDEILEFNNVTADQKLSIGDIIIVPNGKEVLTSAGVTTTSRSRTIASYPSYAGYYSHPIPDGHKTQGTHGYNGVDYGAPIGTPVYAAAEGTVIVSRFKTGSCGRTCFGGYGNYIVIEHPNGTQTLYGHLSAVYTSVGGRVKKGQWIGEVGNTGRSTGAHLHFEVRGAKNPL